MMNNIILHNKLCCRYEILQHCKTWKFRKKIKKNRERADVYGCTGIEGAGYTCNALQRSFDSLQTALVRAIQGKDQARRHIAKMKIKGFNIALIRLSAVCYLTCDIFMFVYKFSRQIFGRMLTFLHLCIVKRKWYHIVITQDIRLLFTRISVKRSMCVYIQKRVIKWWNKKRALILEY